MRLALAPLSLALCAALPAAAQSFPSAVDPADGGLSASGPGQPGTAAPAPPPAPAPAPLPSEPPPPLAPGLSRIAGKVTLAGLAPTLPAIPVTKDMRFCGTSKPDDSLEVGPGGGIRFAVVWMEGAAGAPQAQKPGGKPARVKLDQVGCQFVPHVVLATAGAQLDVVNSDAVLHNVHARSRAGESTVFNYAMPIKGYVIPRKLSSPGILKISCDVHPWMRAIVAVLPTPAAAVTDPQGSFHIDVPPGKYTLHLTHERLGARDEPVELVAGETLRHDISLTPR